CTERGSTMAEVPHPWGAYARLQSKLSTTTSIVFGHALEAALNAIHQPDFSAEGLAEATMLRLAANAARQERHRSALRCKVQAAALEEETGARGNDDGVVSTGASSLDEQLHSRRELQRICSRLLDDDWDLLTSVAAAGIPYDELAASHASTPTALRSRVGRLRQSLMVRRNAGH
ncbi:MAG: hypothetical protein K8D98_01685, partial [Rhodanobacter sp.]|nr:hypothetical protein [Rhodanobacter sp.]